MRGFNGERRFWEGDCEDVSALYATANLALGSDMRLMRLTGPPVLSPLGVPLAYDDTFQTNLIRANAVGVGDADLFGAFGPPPPKFEKWTFTAHQVATWEGKVWDPTFTYGSEASPFLINGSTISAYLSTARWRFHGRRSLVSRHGDQ